MESVVHHGLEIASRQRNWKEMETLVEKMYDTALSNETLLGLGGEGRNALSDSGVDDWFLMDSIGPVLCIAATYLSFVLVLGPRFMRDKPAYDLRYFIIAYNAVLVAFSAWWLYKAAMDGLFSVWAGSMCHPNIDPAVNRKFDGLAWYYLMSKYVELLDTVFFILRRKQNQVTFLHVYHHTNMAVSTWAFVKYVRGSQSLVIGALNTFVHVIMYAYYLLSAFGPKFQKYLWWKKYITTLQIGQFLFVLGYLFALICAGCQVHSVFTIFALANTTSFLILFTNFYRRAYNKKESTASREIKKSD